MFNFGDKVRITKGDLYGATYYIVGWEKNQNSDRMMYQLGAIIDEDECYRIIPLDHWFAADFMKAV